MQDLIKLSFESHSLLIINYSIIDQDIFVLLPYNLFSCDSFYINYLFRMCYIKLSYIKKQKRKITFVFHLFGNITLFIMISERKFCINRFLLVTSFRIN